MNIHPFKKLQKFDKENAKTLLNLNFSVSSWSGNNADDKTLPLIDDFELKRTFKCYDTYGLTDRKFCVLYFSNKLNIMIISFSGTEFISEWIDDFDFRQISPSSITIDENILVHVQHYNLYNSFREELLFNIKNIVNNETLLISTGHSLGGSCASIFFLDVVLNNIVEKRVLYTFGAPRTGNNAFSEVLNKEKTVKRVANTSDLAVSVPPPVIENYIYTHCNGLHFTNNLETYKLNHGQSYLNFLK